jgi:subtilisin family serine protease
MQGNLRWLFPSNIPQNQDDEDGHGTCVASKVTGPTFGVAKRANLVIVKMPGISTTLSQWIAGYAAVARDISSENMEGRAVVCTTLSGEKCLEYWQCKINV